MQDPSMWCLYWPVCQVETKNTTKYAKIIRKYAGVTTDIQQAQSVDKDVNKKTFWHLRMDPWTIAVIMAMIYIITFFTVSATINSTTSMCMILAYTVLSMMISNTNFTCIGLSMSEFDISRRHLLHQ